MLDCEQGAVRLTASSCGLGSRGQAIKIINRKAKKKLAAFSSSSKPSPASAQDVKEDKCVHVFFTRLACLELMG